MICLIKTVSLLLISAAFVFGGRAYAAYKENRARIINEIIVMINTVENCLRYSNAPLNELLGRINAHGKLDFIENCIRKTENGVSFHTAWEESVSDNGKLKPLLGDSAQTLIDFGKSLGVTDTEGQISNCEYYKEVFASELALREEESRKSSKVFPQLGLLAGVFTLIFLI